MDKRAIERVLARVDDVDVEHDSTGKGPWHMVGRSTSDLDTGYPGCLIETVYDGERVSARLKAARLDALAEVIGSVPPGWRSP